MGFELQGLATSRMQEQKPVTNTQSISNHPFSHSTVIIYASCQVAPPSAFARTRSIWRREDVTIRFVFIETGYISGRKLKQKTLNTYKYPKSGSLFIRIWFYRVPLLLVWNENQYNCKTTQTIYVINFMTRSHDRKTLIYVNWFTKWKLLLW
jgi:predicted AlkP superfamily pyrophosphatase or phosphodiesterase